MSGVSAPADFKWKSLICSQRWCVIPIMLGACVGFRTDIVKATGSTFNIKYAAIDLGVYPGDEGSSAEDINAFGHVVGSSFTFTDIPGFSLGPNFSPRAVKWAKGSVRDLGTLPPPFNLGAVANGLNDLGEIVGTSFGAVDVQGRGMFHAFVWHDGQMTDLGTLGGPDSWGTKINEKGQIVGWSHTSQTFSILVNNETVTEFVTHAFLWDHGVMRDLGSLGCRDCPREDFSVASDINNNGEVVGTSANPAIGGVPTGFVWRNGTMRPLFGASRADQAAAYAINDVGQVIGSDDSLFPDGTMIWRGGIDGKVLKCPGMPLGFDINNLGVVLGWAQDPSHDNHFGPTLCAKGQMLALPAVGPRSGDNSPTRMNDFGAVAGHADLLTDNGSYLATHAVVWRLWVKSPAQVP